MAPARPGDLRPTVWSRRGVWVGKRAGLRKDCQAKRRWEAVFLFAWKKPGKAGDDDGSKPGGRAWGASERSSRKAKGAIADKSRG